MNIFGKKAAFILLPVMWLVGCAMAQTSYSLFSPNKQIEGKVRTADRIQYDVFFRGTALLQNSTLTISIDHNTLGLQPKVKAAKEDSHDGTLEPSVRQKFAKIREKYHE